MKELLELIAKELVDNPDKVAVTEKHYDRLIVLELSVAPDDIGKIIGRKGKIVKALRTFIGAVAARDKKRVNIEIV
jgi:predicted RNA-binding protein YlqC (UPF0109 family)